jgi:hypothetical protein
MVYQLTIETQPRTAAQMHQQDAEGESQQQVQDDQARAEKVHGNQGAES